MKVGFISLGCSKNLIDTEMCIGLFKNNNFEISNNPEVSDIIVINTCGFIESAKEEAINTILEMAEYKKTGNCKYLIVIGCLVQRYKEDLQKALPEVDLFISINEYDTMWSKIENLIDAKSSNKKSTLDYLDRVVTTGNTTAYLKIAEGCSNNCTYCAIPYIRGKYISRPIEEILEEATILANKGFEEIIVIAQDTTKYGIDIYGESKLAELLRKLCKIEGFKWIRFLYAYPESITEELIETVKTEEKICKYFDIPIQHISNTVLKRMNRKSNGESIKKLIEKIKLEIPSVMLRTSLIVGFPGETEKDFSELYNFVQETKFNKLGVFKYSKEDGTPAARLKEQIHYKTKQSRFNKIMEVQQLISKEKLENCIGKTYEVLIENKTTDKKYYIARSYMDVPDMDGVIYIKNTKDYRIGEFATCRVVGVNEYDLIGEFNILWSKTKKKN
jgi:ribosomal protein S12 methylthiotransferase